MKLRTLFTVNAWVAFVFGVGFVVLPTTMLSLYGVALGRGGVAIAQLLGAEFLGYAFLAWFAKGTEGPGARRAIVLGFFVSFGVGFVVALLSQLAGAFNVLGWSTVAIYLLFALVYGYFYFTRPDVY
jgi:hypothetical protein